MRKSEVEVGVIYRCRGHHGVPGLAVVLSTTDQYSGHIHGQPAQGYPVVFLQHLGKKGAADPQRLDGITLADFEVTKGQPDPLAQRDQQQPFTSLQGPLLPT